MQKHFTLPYDGGLIEKDLPAGILHSYEKIWTKVYPESRPASYAIADQIVAAINAHTGGLFRLGLTTGTTPTSLYNELARRHQAGEVSFRNVEVVSIDEYYPSSKDELQSRNHRLHEALLDRVDICKENIHIPDGTVPQEALTDYCIQFDAIARELDFLVIGVGEQGQVGFNEAGSNDKTRTRAVRLSYASRKRQSANFNHDLAATPDKAITLGIRTMLSAKRIILMAWGRRQGGSCQGHSGRGYRSRLPGLVPAAPRPYFLLRGRVRSQSAHPLRGPLACRPLRLDAQVHPQGGGMALPDCRKAHTQAH